MEKIVKYEMNEQEHEELENTLALMDEAIRKEIQRLHFLIDNGKRTDSDIICLNTYESLKRDLRKNDRVISANTFNKCMSIIGLDFELVKFSNNCSILVRKEK